MDPAWTPPAGPTRADLSARSPADPRGEAVVHPGLSHAQAHAMAPGTRVRDAPVESAPLEACLPARRARHAADRGGCALSPGGSRVRTPGGGRTTPAVRRRTRGSGPRGATSCGPPVCQDGTARPSPRPHEATAQHACDRGQPKRPMRQNLLLIQPAVRSEHVNSRVKRCRMRQETIWLWKDGIRDMVLEIGWARHHVRVRWTPSWTPVASIVMHSIP
jgi:hypothetical protein